MGIIYEPKGRAFEFSPLAANLYRFCEHGCTYCWSPSVLRVDRETFGRDFKPRAKVLSQLEKDAKKYKNDPRQILLCFTCDPYQPIEEKHQITKRAIEILGEHGLNIAVLTKNGPLAMRDFELFRKYDVYFGTTLVFTKSADCREYEPNAPVYLERVKAIKAAHRMGIRTFVSLEPVIDPKQTLNIIRNIHDIVDHWKIGKINYNKQLEERIDWGRFLGAVLRCLVGYNLSYYIKDELWKYASDFVLNTYQKEK